jgi:hypothetical protein
MGRKHERNTGLGIMFNCMRLIPCSMLHSIRFVSVSRRALESMYYVLTL